MDHAEGTAIVVADPELSVTLGVVGGKTPGALVAGATAAADALKGVIDSKGLFSTISGRRYVRCEGWTTLAAMLGCLPREVSVSKDEDGTYTATVSLVRLSDGMELTRASAECGADEPTWRDRANYARRSMAITRATGKACRIAFSWVMTLAGYEATPAEEIPQEREPATHQVTPPTSNGGAAAFIMPFGNDFKGQPLSAIPTDKLHNALEWARSKGKFVEFQDAADEVLSLRGGE